MNKKELIEKVYPSTVRTESYKLGYATGVRVVKEIHDNMLRAAYVAAYRREDWREFVDFIEANFTYSKDFKEVADLVTHDGAARRHEAAK